VNNFVATEQQMLREHYTMAHRVQSSRLGTLMQFSIC